MVDFDKMPPSRQPEGTFPYMMQQPPKPLYPGNRPITARENYMRIFRNETPYWMPIWLTDAQHCWPDCVHEHAPMEGTGYDWWGQHWTYVEGVNGQMPTPGYRVINDIANWKQEVKIPDLSKVDFEEDAKLQTARYDPERCHLFQCVEGVFERLHELMPMDETLVSFYTEPEAVHEFFEMMVGYKIDLLTRVFKAYDPIDYVIYADDWGTQKAGFFSNEMFREFIMPYTKRIWDFIHSTGRYVELHSCGMTQQYIDEFVEMGLDAWTPQPINDLDMLTEKYGDKISFTVNLPDVENVKDEATARKIIRDFVDKYGPRGRHKVVCGPIMHPDDNIRNAMLEELYYYSSELYAKIRSQE